MRKGNFGREMYPPGDLGHDVHHLTASNLTPQVKCDLAKGGELTAREHPVNMRIRIVF